MKDLFLVVSGLGTDTEGETLHYEVQVDGKTIVGDFKGRWLGTDYRRSIGTVDDGANVQLLTPDARLRLVVLPQEA